MKKKKRSIPKAPKMPKYKGGGKFETGLKDFAALGFQVSTGGFAPNEDNPFGEYSDTPFGNQVGQVSGNIDAVMGQSTTHKMTNNFTGKNESDRAGRTDVQNESYDQISGAAQPVKGMFSSIYGGQIGMGGGVPVQDTQEQQFYRNGGPHNGIPNAELEKKEFMRFPDGSTDQVNGPSHENGGVQVNIPDGTHIYSDKLKMPGTKKTFAKMATKYSTEKDEKVLGDKNSDRLAKSTAQRNIDLKNRKLSEIFNTQESVKQAKGLGVNDPAYKARAMNYADRNYELGEEEFRKKMGNWVSPGNEELFDSFQDRNSKKINSKYDKYNSNLDYRDGGTKGLPEYGDGGKKYAKSLEPWSVTGQPKNNSYTSANPEFQAYVNKYRNEDTNPQNTPNMGWALDKSNDQYLGGDDPAASYGDPTKTSAGNTNSGGFDWMKAAQIGSNMAGDIYNLASNKRPEAFTYHTPQLKQFDPTQALREKARVEAAGRKFRKGLYAGNAAAAIAGETQADAIAAQQRANLVQGYDDRNIGAYNQMALPTAQIRNKNIDAIQADEARWRDINREAVGQISSKGSQSIKDIRMDQSQEDIIENMMKTGNYEIIKNENGKWVMSPINRTA